MNFAKVVSEVPQLARGQVWCRSCGSTRRVNSDGAMNHGWPKCCSMTMTIDAPEEDWRQVPSYPLYEANRAGQIRRQSASQGTSGAILKPGTDTKGYLHVSIYNGSGQRKYVRVHIMVAEAFIGTCPDGQQVNHKNRNKADPAATNLEYVTPSENIQHSYNGRAIAGRRGEENGGAKLTERTVRAIRSLLRKGIFHKDIADRFGISKTTVDRIATKRTWQWLTP